MSDDHTHAVAPGRAFAIGIGLNVVFVVVEVGYGLASESVALVADAAHNTSDVLGLVLAWAATALAKRRPSARRTYGLRRTTILATLANAILLLVAVGGVVWEAVGRLAHPGPVEGVTVIVVAALGVAVNGVSALFFFRGKSRDANLRGAFLHLAADALVSLGVVLAGVIIVVTGWRPIDPLVSILVSLAILRSTWSLFRDALDASLDAVPAGIDPEAVRAFLLTLPAVCDVHDLHIWAMSTTEAALTTHLVMPWPSEPPGFLAELDHELERRFGIAHTTVQLEPLDADRTCTQASDDVV